MNPKTVFFDLDGTLLAPKCGRPFQIPEDTLSALTELKQNGHHAAACTGRPEAFIKKFFPGIFQSFVALNGAHVVFEGKTVSDRCFAPERVRAMTERFDSYGCRYVFVGKNHGWARNVPAPEMDRLNACYALPEFLVTRWKPEDVSAGTMDFVFLGEADYEKQRGAFTGGVTLNWHPGGFTADLGFPGCTKASGISQFLSFAGIRREDTVAFGDGYNDLAMMSAVGCGVAMGNAADKVKQAADFVTADIFDGGVSLGLKHLGLI